ncbi:2-polyprenyl-3-methyl-6-methoxy-1,4-benzoquinone monooxygenase [Legionella yabuuchiae]|uniref:2-polyprenyl-3-methyl-6-methoxy-1,4-benzoquinone monooxygenase n=1 Tax=Legionella yabuuchiae TaxID=376727 RepID=UPI0010565E46|nr:2-polyprenyl-3-methyl-6-methoxy-1,4-benzoquinone monooxygenase [Legionella yabuuchiae]
MRHFTAIDEAIAQFDTTLRTLFIPTHRAAARKNPGLNYPMAALTAEQKRHIAGLMRVNHAGEVCAQALYQGQALTAKLHHVREQMAEAAEEEVDHLAWCEQRLRELDSQPSVFNPMWYAGSLLIGMVAGLAGDQWSLGFVAETERQVSAHLERHLRQLPEDDERTMAILAQMHEDETQHAQSAQRAGAAELPWLIKRLMSSVSKLMTRSSYYL